METAVPLQENMARDDNAQDSSTLRVIKPHAGAAKTMLAASGGSQSLPNSPRFGVDKKTDGSLVESRHQWIRKELLDDKKNRRGLTSSASFSPRSHALVDQRHQWIETEILSKHSAFERVNESHRLSTGPTVAVDSLPDESESSSMSRDQYLSNSTSDPSPPEQSFSPIVFLGDIESPHHKSSREEQDRPFFMDSDDRTAVVALDSTMTDVDDVDIVETMTEPSTSVLVAIAHEETVEILMEKKSTEYDDAVEVTMKGDSFWEEPSQKAWTNREGGTTPSREMLVKKAAASEKLSGSIAGAWKHEAITVVSSEVPINEMTEVDIIERIWAHDKSPLLDHPIDIRALQTIDSTATNGSDADSGKNAVAVRPFDEEPFDALSGDTLAMATPTIFSSNDIKYVKSFERPLSPKVDPAIIALEPAVIQGPGCSSSFESGELIPDSKLRVHLETPVQKDDTDAVAQQHECELDSAALSDAGPNVATNARVNQATQFSNGATESPDKSVKPRIETPNKNTVASLGLSVESIVSDVSSNDHTESKAHSIETFDTNSQANPASVDHMDFLHTRKGKAFVDHAKRSAQRFQKVKDQLLEDRHVRHAVSRESSRSFRDDDNSAHREHAARSAQRFQKAKEELLGDAMVGELLSKISGSDRTHDGSNGALAVCVEDPTETSDHNSTKHSPAAYDEIVRVPTVDGPSNGKKEASSQEPVKTPCMASCVVM